jgi:glycosyltransferase involved in cell wall biosynthesis
MEVTIFSIILSSTTVHNKYIKKICRYLSNNQKYVSELIIVVDPIKGLSAFLFRLKLRVMLIILNWKIPVHLLLSSSRLYSGLARNSGWLKAKSEWLMFLDADDEYADSRFAIIENYIALTPSANVFVHSYCSSKEEFPDFKPFFASQELPKTISPETIKNATIKNLDLHDSNNLFVPNFNGGFYPVHHGHLTVRKSLMKDHMFPCKVKAEDTDFCRSVLFGAGGIFHIPLKLSRYHPFKSSWRNSPWPKKFTFLAKHKFKQLITNVLPLS